MSTEQVYEDMNVPAVLKLKKKIKIKITSSEKLLKIFLAMWCRKEHDTRFIYLFFILEMSVKYFFDLKIAISYISSYKK